MVSSSEARTARRARRLFCSARVWSGVTDEVAASLHSDNETFFGSDLETSDSESPPSSPPTKRPRLSMSGQTQHLTVMNHLLAAPRSSAKLRVAAKPTRH